MNPAYVGELRALDEPRARGFTGSDIFDVLGVEVDGVDIAAGVGEARVLVAVDELAQALLRLGEGEPAAQATIGPGPTELVLEARGPDLQLSLVSLAPPARVLAAGLLVDAQKMRTAVLHAARGLLLDLLGISPVLGDTPLAERLARCSAELARRPPKAPRRWPARESAARALSFPAGAQRAARLQLQLPPETMARLRGQASVKHAPLAPHLGQGSLALQRRGAPGLVCEGSVFLLLRNLVADTERLVEAWEGGARDFNLRFGPHELQCDLTTDEVRAPAWRKPALLPALRVAELVTLAALGYAEQARADDELARDLRDRALALRQHCTDLETGDLRRAPETVAAPAPAVEARTRQGPLAPGRMRRLVYREVWRTQAQGALRALPFANGPLVIELPHALEARDAETGDHLWRVEAAPGAVARDGELFYAEPGDALVRLEAATGEARWKRRMRGAAHPARLWALPSGVARSLPGEGLALVSDAGSLSFRARLPGGAPSHLIAADRVLVTALGSGALAGLDPSDARILWKRRCKVSALVPAGGRALALCEGSLACLDPHDGAPVWEREVPAGAGPPVVCAGDVHLLAGGSLLSFSLATGAPRPPLPLPWARHLAAADDPELLLATGEGGAAMRLDGKRWSLPPESAAPATPPQTHRGVVLLQRSLPTLYDADQGLPLAQLPEARLAVLASELSCTLLDEATLSVHRLATHLSLLG